MVDGLRSRCSLQMTQDVNDAGYPTLYNSYTQRGLELDHMSVYDYIERYVPGGHRSQLGALLDVAYNIEYGAETNVQSSLNLLYLIGFSEPGHVRDLRRRPTRSSTSAAATTRCRRFSPRSSASQITANTPLTAIKQN